MTAAVRAGVRHSAHLEWTSLPQDLVQGNFLDTYYNLTYKSVMGHLWVSEFCRQAELVVKTDDDIYVDLYGAFSLAGRLRAEENYRENMFMMGPVNRFFTEIIRSPDHPWNKWLGKQDHHRESCSDKD